MTDSTLRLPITRVTLYTSGVGYFERSGEVEGTARLTLSFPLGQINDVLKSLVLLDTGDGALQPVTYAAQDPVSRALQAFSIDVGDSPDRATLLGRMRGANVTVTTDDTQPLTGLILSVESQTVSVSDHRTTQQQTLNLLTDDGLHAVPLPAVRRLQINDAALDADLRQALAAVAQGRDANKRPVTITFDGQGRRPVQVGYLAEAPAWQTTYRLVLGDAPLLQGWALVQNTGQDDWADAHLSLISGRPISFIQDLYTPLYVHRPTVQPRIPASPVPQTYGSSIMAEEEPMYDMSAATLSAAPAGEMTRSRKAMASSMPAPTPALSIRQAAAQTVATTGAQIGAALFAYHIDVPVSVPRQQSAMIPFVASPVQAERVSVYNAHVQSDHPLSGARLKNTTSLHLMGGPLTVFDAPETGDGEARYVGDALIDDTEPGQTRLLTYAIDLAVDAEAGTNNYGNTVVGVSISQGTLRISMKSVIETMYAFKNHGAHPRTLIIEHNDPGPQWALTEPATPTERTAELYRFETTSPAGGTATLSVRQERFLLESLTLLGTHVETLLSYGNLDQTSKSVRAALADLSARRAQTHALEAKIEALDSQLEAIGKGQERIRLNMQSLDHKSELYRRYVGELDTQETQIAKITHEMQTLINTLTQNEADLSEYVSRLDLT